jgi:hypothetical protein
VLAIEEGNSMSNKRLQLKAQVAIVTIVDLAFDFRVGEGLLRLQGVDGDIDQVFLVGDAVHGSIS